MKATELRRRGCFARAVAHSIEALENRLLLSAGIEEEAYGAIDGPPAHLAATVEAPPTIAWQRSFGGDGFDQLYSLQQTSDGGYILGGGSYSGVSGNKTSPHYGLEDYWIVRLDANGNKLWDKSFGGSGDDILFSLQQTSDGGFILGGQSSSDANGTKTSPNYGTGAYDSADYWVVRLDASGNQLWDKSFGGGSYDRLYSLQQTSDGGFILGGGSSSGVSGTKTSPNYGEEDYWVVRLDAGGNQLWDKSFGGSRYEELFSLQQTSDGGFILGGWSFSLAGGNKTSPNYGEEDYWVVRLDASGNKLWDKSFGGSDDDWLYSLRQTSDGGFILGGESSSGADGSKTSPNYGTGAYDSADYWVVRLDASGNQLWDQSLGGSDWDSLVSLQETSAGGYIVGGYSSSPADGTKTDPNYLVEDYWVVRLDASGNPLWDQSFGGGGYDYLSSLQQTSDGWYILGGSSDSPADGTKTSPNHGDSDFWVVKLGAQPAVTVTVDEGQAAILSGTLADFGTDVASLSASVGFVGMVGTAPNGTWNWSYPTIDGPAENQMVTITATDSLGATTSIVFGLVVNNVAPWVMVTTAPPTATAGVATVISPLASFVDPGSADTHVASIDWGDSTPLDVGTIDQATGTVSGSHVYATPGIYGVKVMVTDDGGASDWDVFTLHVLGSGALGTISGMVFNDSNLNGAFDYFSEAGLAGRTVYLDVNNNGRLDSGIFASPNVPVNIDDLMTVSSTVEVSGYSGPIVDLNLALDISHTWDSDLDIWLTSPAGTRVLMVSENGDDGENFTGTVLDDEAQLSIFDGFAPFAGPHRPLGSLAQFDGEDPNGIWTLEIVDNYRGDTGQLNSWSLILDANYGEPIAITDEAGVYAFTDLELGDYTVRQALPGGWTETVPAGGAYAVQLDEWLNYFEVADFGSVRGGAIAGQVFEDSNSNGVYEPESEAVLAGRTVYLDSNNNGQLDSATGYFDPLDVPIVITDAGTITSTVEVNWYSGTIGDLDLELDVTHPWDGDLSIWLTSPAGTQVLLVSENGGSGNDFSETVLDDEAQASILDGMAPFTGPHRPIGSLAQFDGEDPIGTWTLTIADGYSGDTGQLNSWALIFNHEPVAITDEAGAYAFTDLELGDYTVRQVLPDGWTETAPVVGAYAVQLDEWLSHFRGADFGSVRGGAIAGRVFEDSNGNGVYEPESEAVLAGRAVYLDSNNNGQLDSASGYFDSQDVPIAIADEGTVTSTVQVSGYSGLIVDLDLLLDISHTWDSDVDIWLTSPAGTRVLLIADNGGREDDFAGTVLDDEAKASILDGMAPFAGPHRPLGSLAEFDGEDPNGTWTLTITDDTGGDTGQLNNWSLIFNGEPVAVTDEAGAYAFTDLSPGDYTVRQLIPSGWTATAPADGAYAVHLAAGDRLEGYDFGSAERQIVVGTSGNDAYWVRLGRVAPMIHVFKDSPTSAPILLLSLDTSGPLRFETGGGNDTLTIDLTYGNPIPAAGLVLDGGDGVDSISIGGTSLSDALSGDSSGLRINSSAITASAVESYALAATGSAPIVLSSLSLSGSAQLALPPGGNVLRLSSLSIADNASLDLADNALILQSAEPDKDALLGTLTDLLGAGQNAGGGNGPSLRSSVANADPQGIRALGLLLNRRGGTAAYYASFAGQSVDADSILVALTRRGDSDLNGTIDASDYFRLARGVARQSTGWINGDFNHDRLIDEADHGLIDRAFLAQRAGKSAQAGRAAPKAAKKAGRAALKAALAKPKPRPSARHAVARRHA